MASEDHNRKRGQIQAKLTRIKKTVDSFQEGRPQDLSVRLTEIENIKQSFEAHQNSLYDNYSDEVDEVSYEDLQKQQEPFENDFEILFFEVKASIQEKLDKLLKTSSKSSSSTGGDTLTHNVGVDLKLPPIPLPTFDGTSAQWIYFRDNFNGLIDKTSLDYPQKVHYLYNSLGKDPKIVMGNPVYSEDGYKEAWKSLKKRYDNNKLIIENHVAEIFKLKQISSPSASELRNLSNIITVNLSALKSLKQPVDQWDLIIIHLVKSALDKDSKTAWEFHQNKEKLPTWEEMQDFLEKRIRVLESLQSSSSSSSFKNNKNDPIKKTVHTVTQNHQPKTCIFCRKNHSSIFQCEKFQDSVSIADRFKEVHKQNACMNCLNVGHRYKECQKDHCKKCSLKHHTLLHEDRQNQKEDPQKKPGDQQPEKKATTMAHVSNQRRNVLLSTAIVYVQDQRGVNHKCRALLDSGSESNLMTESLVSLLGLTRKSTFVPISGINQMQMNVKHRVKSNISSCAEFYSQECDFLVVNRITGNLPSTFIDISEWNLPENLVLADPQFNNPAKIDLLLGIDVFVNVLKEGRSNKFAENLPHFLDTRFGLVVGGSHIMKNTLTCVNLDPGESSFSDLNESIQKFWSLESVDNGVSQLSPEDQVVESHFQKTISKDESGRYVVSLPLRENVCDLGNSFQNAHRNFLALERRLSEKPEVQAMYHDFMKEYLSLGHMSLVSSQNIPDDSYFIPHHFVLKPSSTTTKLRVVFNGSAKTTSGLSVNDAMFTGPTVQSDLFSIVLKFRKYPFVFTADIEKMYRTILVSSPQRKYQSILWRFSQSDPIQVYELNTVTYGLRSSPYLATRVLKQISIDSSSEFPVASKSLAEDFYVDDVLSGGYSVSEIQQKAQDLIRILLRSGMHLRKFCSNNKEFFDVISEVDRDKVIDFENSNVNEAIKSLGIVWNPVSDKFLYKQDLISSQSKKFTKRRVLSVITQIFDPLGIIGPVTVLGKLFMQSLWRSQVGWDEEIVDDELKEGWEYFSSQLHLVNQIEVDRCVVQRDSDVIELHGFCDASEHAYGACLYVRTIAKSGNIQVKLLCAKSRVAPLQKQTIPRLELCSAVLLAELVQKVVESIQITFDRVVLWGDSTIALSWIKTPSYKLKTFVANRVARIQDLTSKYQWRHVPTDDNPADIISRGLMPDHLKHFQIWFNGPPFLSNSEDLWPNSIISIQNLEIPELKVVACTTAHSEKSFAQIHLHKYSSFKKLLNVTAYCVRFIKNLKAKKSYLGLGREIGCLKSHELNESLDVLVKLVQHEVFSNEYAQLSSNSQKISGRNKLLNLNPFLHNGIIRVGGRLENSELSFSQKHPIILPGTHHFTKLLFEHEHIKNLHSGPQLLLSIIHQKYWILGGKRLAKHVFHKCLNCFRTHPKGVEQLMGNLPKDRVCASRPFSVVGIDLAGPLSLTFKYKRSKIEYKAYIVIFICFATKAIHLEIVQSLSSDDFIATLKRFMARRGKPSKIWSDNGTNFVGANNQLNDLRKFWSEEVKSEIIKSMCASEGIEWHFIPPRSPTFGGLWEANVKSVKTHLKRVVGSCNLTFEELNTLIVQIEACVNSRPLTELSSDPNDFQPLTPAHFLVGGPLLTVLEPNVEDVPYNRLKHWQQITKMTQSFWSRWSLEYLNTLQQRLKWKTTQVDVVENQLVLIHEDNTPPMRWLLGRITEVVRGSDGRVRVVHLRTKNGNLTRAITKIFPIPVETDVSKASLCLV